MARDRGNVVPFNQRNDAGPMGFRYPAEPRDERPVVLLPALWEDESERIVYEAAVRDNPRKAGEGPLAYIARISAIVTGQYQRAGLPMPRRMSQAAWNRRQNELKQQASEAWSEDWRGTKD